MSASKIAFFISQFLDRHVNGKAFFQFANMDDDGPYIDTVIVTKDTKLMPIGDDFLLIEHSKESPLPEIYNIHDLQRVLLRHDDGDAPASSQVATTAPLQDLS